MLQREGVLSLLSCQDFVRYLPSVILQQGKEKYISYYCSCNSKKILGPSGHRHFNSTAKMVYSSPISAAFGITWCYNMLRVTFLDLSS